MIDLSLIITSILLGLGLAMDAFSVSLANGLNEPRMKSRKIFLIAGIFAFFQAAMPLIGWLCIHTVVEYFSAFEKFIPYIALALLAFIGGKMIRDSFGAPEAADGSLKIWDMFLAALATSIDALAVGVTFSMLLNTTQTFGAIGLIGVTTFVLSAVGVKIGTVFGDKFSSKAQLLGGVILVLIGLKILLEHLGVISF